MIKITIYILLFALCSSLSFAANNKPRIFTDKQDRSIEAAIIGYDHQRGLVELQLGNKRRKKVKPSIFCEEDQAYIKDWAMVQEFMSSCFTVKIEKATHKKWKEMVQTGVLRNNEEVFYIAKLQNKSSDSIGKIQIEYNIYYEQETRGRGKNVPNKEHKTGSFEINEINARSNKRLNTKRVVIYKQRISGPYSGYSDGTPTNQSGKMKGIWMKVYIKTPSGVTAVREFCEPSDVSERQRWFAH